MNIDILIYTSGAVLMMFIYLGFLLWAVKTEQFKDNQKLRFKPLEDDEKEK